MGSGGTQVPKGGVFGGDGAVQGRKGERAVQRRRDEEAAVYRQQNRHQVGAGQSGRLRGGAGCGGTVAGERFRDRVRRRFPRGADMGTPGLPMAVGSVVMLPGQSVGLDLAWVSIQKPGGGGHG